MELGLFSTEKSFTYSSTTPKSTTSQVEVQEIGLITDVPVPNEVVEATILAYGVVEQGDNVWVSPMTLLSLVRHTFDNLICSKASIFVFQLSGSGNQ